MSSQVPSVVSQKSKFSATAHLTVGNKSSYLGNLGCHCLKHISFSTCGLHFDTDVIFRGHDLMLALGMELICNCVSDFTLHYSPIKFYYPNFKTVQYPDDAWPESLTTNVTTLSSGPSGFSLITFLALFPL